MLRVHQDDTAFILSLSKGMLHDPTGHREDKDRVRHDEREKRVDVENERAELQLTRFLAVHDRLFLVRPQFLGCGAYISATCVSSMYFLSVGLGLLGQASYFFT